MLYKEITQCRACGSKNLHTVLDLGNLPISDFPTRVDHINKAPLEMVECGKCTLVQLRHTVSRNLIYGDSYWYKSGTNESMVRSLKELVGDTLEYTHLNKGDYVLDIGCNDGTMLDFFPNWVRRHGFEPAQNMAREAKAKGHGVYTSYFPPGWGIRDKYRVITSVAQLYNTENLEGYVKRVKNILHRNGVWCIQMAFLPDTLSSNNLGDFCHEHLTFWTVESLGALLSRYDLGIVDVSFNSVNGGSFRAMVKHGKCTGAATGPSPDFEGFAKRIEYLRQDTLILLNLIKREGKTVIGLGASTKNNTVLSWYGVGTDLIKCFADRQISKVGRYTVTGIPIVSEEVARMLQPDYFFVGPYHFLDSLKVRERAFLEQGRKFIVPFPELSVFGGEPCKVHS